VPPPPEKLQRTSNTIVGLLPLIFGIWFGVFPIGTACRPIQLQSATRRPDCAWTVGIASVGTVCRNSVVYPFNTIHALLCDRRTVGETNGQVDRNCCNACIACYATKLWKVMHKIKKNDTKQNLRKKPDKKHTFKRYKNKLHRLTQRDSMLAHFYAQEILGYFRCKIWRHTLALWPWFPTRITKFRAYLAQFSRSESSDTGQTDRQKHMSLTLSVWA